MPTWRDTGVQVCPRVLPASANRRGANVRNPIGHFRSQMTCRTPWNSSAFILLSILTLHSWHHSLSNKATSLLLIPLVDATVDAHEHLGSLAEFIMEGTRQTDQLIHMIRNILAEADTTNDATSDIHLDPCVALCSPGDGHSMSHQIVANDQNPNKIEEWAETMEVEGHGTSVNVCFTYLVKISRKKQKKARISKNKWNKLGISDKK